MKIISKFKDYYDFHQGEFGVDPLKILDRSEYYSLMEYEEFNHDYLFFCGKWYFKGESQNLKYSKFMKITFDVNYRHIVLKIVFKDENIYWGEITNISEIKNRLWNPDSLKIIEKTNKAYYLICMWDRSNNIQRKDAYYPILKEIGFDKVFNSKDCYLMIEGFISKKDLDVKIDPTDMTVFEQKGFDKKKSFRN